MGNDEQREFRVRVKASGYAIVRGKTKAEAVQNARQGNFIHTQRPVWFAEISDIKEMAPKSRKVNDGR